MDAFGVKPFLQLRYTERKFCIFLHAEGFLNAPKENKTPFGVQWSRMDAFGVKIVSELRNSKLGHLGPRHKFSIFLHGEGFLNAPKDNKT
jgi:hypothetical protein